MKNCRICDKPFSARITIDGCRYTLRNRQNCTDCVPFKQPRTKKPRPDRKEYLKGKAKEWYDKNPDSFQIRRTSRRNAVLAILGNSCGICGYDKCRKNLAFHHVHENTKSMGLTMYEFQLSSDRVLPELLKCILVCHNCHGEIHDGMIAESVISVLHSKQHDLMIKLQGMTWDEVVIAGRVP